jgi:hypothetical protein
MSRLPQMIMSETGSQIEDVTVSIGSTSHRLPSSSGGTACAHFRKIPKTFLLVFNVATLRPPELLEFLPEPRDPGLGSMIALGKAHQHTNAPHALWLL